MKLVDTRVHQVVYWGKTSQSLAHLWRKMQNRGWYATACRAGVTAKAEALEWIRAKSGGGWPEAVELGEGSKLCGACKLHTVSIVPDELAPPRPWKG